MVSGSSSLSAAVVSEFEQTYGTIPVPVTASIGDIAFLDVHATGVESSFNSGPGVAGVTVDLLNSTGTSVLATTTTNSSGLYGFTGLAPGVYEVEFVAPANFDL